MKWEPKDVITLIVVIGSMLLMALGHNHIVTYVFAATIMVYIGFDINIRRKQKNGKPAESERDHRDRPHR